MIIKDTRVGKNNKKIVKALFKVIAEDTEYEICAREDYLKFVEEEINRLTNAQIYYKRHTLAASEKKKEYYRQGVEMYLRHNNGETADNFEQVLEEYKQALTGRKEHIKELYKELKEIKKLRV